MIYCRCALVCSIPAFVLSNWCLLLAGIQFRLPTSCSVDRAQPPPGTSLSPSLLFFAILALTFANYISVAVIHLWVFKGVRLLLLTIRKKERKKERKYLPGKWLGYT